MGDVQWEAYPRVAGIPARGQAELEHFIAYMEENQLPVHSPADIDGPVAAGQVLTDREAYGDVLWATLERLRAHLASGKRPFTVVGLDDEERYTQRLLVYLIYRAGLFTPEGLRRDLTWTAQVFDSLAACLRLAPQVGIGIVDRLTADLVAAVEAGAWPSDIRVPLLRLLDACHSTIYAEYMRARVLRCYAALGDLPRAVGDPDVTWSRRMAQDILAMEPEQRRAWTDFLVFVVSYRYHLPQRWADDIRMRLASVGGGEMVSVLLLRWLEIAAADAATPASPWNAEVLLMLARVLPVALQEAKPSYAVRAAALLCGPLPRGPVPRTEEKMVKCAVSCLETLDPARAASVAGELGALRATTRVRTIRIAVDRLFAAS